VDFIEADCTEAMTKIKAKADLIFVNPSVRDDSSIDLFHDTTPSLSALIESSLEIAPNLIILLPKNIDHQQIASMFFAYFKYSGSPRILEYNYSIEIESIVVDSIVEYHIIYFGEKSSLKK
jgi:hypothetical protein